MDLFFVIGNVEFRALTHAATLSLRPAASFNPLILVASFGVLFGCLTGCASPKATRPDKPADPVELRSFWKPHLLFLKSAPHPGLYVEVDAVEGMAPDDESLRRLLEFLEAHCAKPAGIQIVRDTVIPREQARGVAPVALARRYMSGPKGETNSPPAAFIYILFFDTALSRDGGTNRNRSAVSPITPHAILWPYPALIFADPQINGPLKAPKLSLLFGSILQHEAGHLFGLGRNPAHCADGHCQEESCLMYPEYSVSERLAQELFAEIGGFPRTRLCSKCEGDVKAYASEPGPSNLRFVGPVLVRSEPGYEVFTLADRLKIVVGKFDVEDVWKFARTTRNEPLQLASRGATITLSAWVKPEVRRDRALFWEILQRVRRDPDSVVRRAASLL